MAYARQDLFEKAACIVTPANQVPLWARTALTEFWQQLGMSVFERSPTEHDAIVAHVSHLPHLLASILSAYLADQDSNWKQMAGPGLKDTTRVAAGDAELWRQILETNRAEVLKAIDGFSQELSTLRTALAQSDTEDLLAILEKGRAFREAL